MKDVVWQEQGKTKVAKVGNRTVTEYASNNVTVQEANGEVLGCYRDTETALMVAEFA